jgi:hypothetical protein
MHYQNCGCDRAVTHGKVEIEIAHLSEESLRAQNRHQRKQRCHSRNLPATSV